MKQVPNEFPQINHEDKIAFVGDAPGADEEQYGRPFIGASGNLLNQAISAGQILRSSCFVGNISQVRPPNNDVNRFKWEGWQIQQGLKQLKVDLDKFDPNLVVLLGATALKAGGQVLTKGRGTNELRGTLFECRDLESPMFGRKCLCTVHPSAVIRQYSLMPLFVFDMKRAKEEATSKELHLPEPMLDLDLHPREIIEKLDDWPKGKLASFDLEGGVNPEEHLGITCMAIADSPDYAFILDFKNMRDEWKASIYDSLKRFLEDPDIPKVAQGGLYELFCCAWKWKIHVRSLVRDTMLSGWEIYPELPKSLGTQVSIWTRRQFFKDERKIIDDRSHNIYCCKDATATHEIDERHQEYFEANPDAKRHYELNMSLLPMLAYIQVRGFKYNHTRSKEIRNEIAFEQDELQARIDVYNGEPLNCNSPKQLQNALYKRMGFEPQYQIEKGRKTNKLTCNDVALLKLLKKYNSDLVYHILKWKHLDGIRKQLDVKFDSDGRIRSAYNPVGTETGRYTCYASNTGGGYNLQTTTKRLRELFVADEGMSIAQVDLSGADGWTVAAHAAELGDSRMLEDLQHGIKPAKVICALHLTNDPHIATLASDALATRFSTKKVDGKWQDFYCDTPIPKWLYAAAKAVQHGSSYGMGKITMSNNILRQSWKKSGEAIYVAPKDCLELQNLFFMRYSGVLNWQTWVEIQLKDKGYLKAASGHTRRFFGRRSDNSVLQAAYSQEPQANTTYATALAAQRLWNDSTNRQNGYLTIEPLHQVHDALIVQFPTNRSESATAKLREWFTNEITIANRPMVIPFEGEYGQYWGDDSEGIITMTA